LLEAFDPQHGQYLATSSMASIVIGAARDCITGADDRVDTSGDPEGHARSPLL
jgi:hypothetical protein